MSNMKITRLRQLDRERDRFELFLSQEDRETGEIKFVYGISSKTDWEKIRFHINQSLEDNDFDRVSLDLSFPLQFEI